MNGLAMTLIWIRWGRRQGEMSALGQLLT